jgi:methylase of polypeptide subunit release factors
MHRDDALHRLLLELKARHYRFVAVTPATHARVLERQRRGAATLRDIFGWNQTFQYDDVDPELLDLMKQAAIAERTEHGFRSTLRVASLGEDLFLHSAFPTDDPDAVFFGPDTYRFARFVAQQWPRKPPPQVVDMGAGSGAGGIAASRLAPAAKIALLDTNPAALALAGVNARAAGVQAELLESGSLPVGANVVIANPPYMMDPGARTYRDGGELLGGQVALDWTRDALAKLAPGGTLLLYTGAAVADGTAPLVPALERACTEAGATLAIEELDPDVFGEELEQPAYTGVERIAAIGAIVRVPE